MNKGVQHWQSTSIYYSITHECIPTLALHRHKANMCMCVSVRAFALAHKDKQSLEMHLG